MNEPATVWAVCRYSDGCGEPGCDGAAGMDVLRLFATRQTAEQWASTRRRVYLREVTVHTALRGA